MSNRNRLRQATTAVVMLGCMIAATSVPSAVAHSTPATPALPPYAKAHGTVFRVKAVLPVDGYHLTGRFGDVSGYWATVHTGLDFAAAYGTPIRSIEDGIVVSAAYDGSYGNKTVVRLEDGTEIWYCHQSQQTVAVGDQVAAGEVIGYIGTTGNTTGPHLHLEWHPGGGDAVDPFPALRHLGLRP